MTTSAGRPSARRRATIVGLCAAVLAATATLAPAGGALASQESPAARTAAVQTHPHGHGHSHGHPRARTATVMTRNLYLGAELTTVLTALASGDDAAIVGAATQTWAAVQATDPPERMAAIADEIVAADPDLVGLQEVTQWTTYTFDPVSGVVSEPVVAYDFLALLLDALAARGVHYRAVEGAIAHNFASPPIPILATPTATVPRAAVQLADRDVILARDDVGTTNARTGTYDTIVGFPFNGTVLPVPRGWGSVDVTARRAHFRFVNSHLEAFGLPGVDAEAVRVAQVGELLAAQDTVAAQSGELPMVYVGDYNSDAPDAPAYSRLLAGVGQDAWTRSHRHAAGLTCCFGATVDDPDNPLTSRIDLVLASPDVRAPRATVVGDEVADMTPSGLWPSDHAGVVARLVFPAAR
ncbi:endonuclease/exonuclease/phosphatase family protein [Nocardioides sp. P5_C9_2]